MKIIFTYIRLLIHFFRAFWILFFQFPNLDKLSQGKIIQKWAAELLNLLEISVEVKGAPRSLATSNKFLLVANHISWLDPIVVQSLKHTIFVAKHEVGNWPVIGIIAKRCGVIFVKRGSSSSTRKMLQSMKDALQNDNSIAGFPEGTSSEGRHVGLFYSNLFQVAIDNSCEVIAVCLLYKDLKNQSFSLVPAFVNDMGFIHSLHRVICAPPMVVSVVVSEPIVSAGHTRRTLAQVAQSKVTDQFISIN